jgi:hypothetical protein
MLQDYKSPLNPAATAFIESYEREYEELVKKLNDLDNETN